MQRAAMVAALRESGIRSAKALLICISRDDATVLVALTARGAGGGRSRAPVTRAIGALA